MKLKAKIRFVNYVNTIFFMINCMIANLFIFRVLDTNYDYVKVATISLNFMFYNLILFLSWESLELRYKVFLYSLYEISFVSLIIIKYSDEFSTHLEILVISVFLTISFIVTLWIYENKNIDNFLNYS